ncbi:hypothetical protein Y88_1766 [Novosphingobium nitrogenifigens DSM 19370]|uniref:Uncharacterized protein n=1 Tax=Novosphingobium nitrogenifigens DSM 19370 TaxID=983920 RepID=F1Z3Z1_9SPHN|nr:hypothetical protein Y88_1766 [Novosphingobium nitrogenifigens DSM 19370]
MVWAPRSGHRAQSRPRRRVRQPSGVGGWAHDVLFDLNQYS